MVVHRVSGVVNVAHGAMASLATYVFVDLRSELPLAVALAVALLGAAALGLIVHLAVFRPLRNAPVLARVVASVGLMVAIQAAIVLRFGSVNRSVAAILPAQPTRLLGLDIPRDRLLLVAVVVAAAIGLWAFGRFTRFGLATRAVADDATTAALLGWSPDAVAAVNWALASVLAALAGILAAPISSLNPTTYSLLVVPALAAAMAGGLSSYGGTVAAALGVGMVQSWLVKLQGDFSWLPQSGLREGLPFLVIVVAMVVRGRSLAARDEPVGARLPSAPRPRGTAAVTAAAAGSVAVTVALFAFGPQLRLALVQSLIAAVVCLSLVVLTGYLGQISLAQMTFAGVAGFTLSRLGEGMGVPFPLAPAAAALIAGVLGVVIGLPALRVRGVNLAVVTLAGAVAVVELVFRNPSLTRGVASSRVPDPAVGALDLGIGGTALSAYPRPRFGLFVLAVLVAVALAMVRLRRGRFGRRLLAVRANERAAAVAGVDVAATKLAGFGLSATVAGLGGALLGYSQGQLTFASFGVFVSLSYLAVTYLGGIGRISGALVGALLISDGLGVALVDRVADLGRYQLLVTGLGLVAIAVRYPDGLAAAVGRVPAAGRSWRARRERMGART